MFRFSPYCGCGGSYVMECSLVYENIQISGAAYFNNLITNLRRSLDNEEGFHKGFRIINGNEVVPVTAENSSVPYANLLIWLDSYRNGSYIQRVFYTDESKTVGQWIMDNTQALDSNSLWHTGDGVNNNNNTSGIVFHPERQEPDYFRIFVSQFDYSKYPLNFEYDGTAAGYRNAPHLFLPEVDDPKEYYLTCNYRHLPNCGEGTHTFYKTGTDSNPYIFGGAVYQFWDSHREQMHWGTSREFVGFYGLTTTSATFASSTPTVDEMAERVGKCKHIDGIKDEFEARWNHDVTYSMGNCQHWLFSEAGHFIARALEQNGTTTSFKGYTDNKNRRIWSFFPRGISGNYYGYVPTRFYPGSIDDEPLLYADSANSRDKIRGRVYVYGRSQLCSPFSTTFHHYSSFMFPLGKYEIIPNNDPAQISYHGNSYYLYELKMKKRVHAFTHQDFQNIKLNMPGTENYYTEYIETAPFNHQDLINGFGVVAYPETNLFTDPDDVLPDFHKTQGHIIGAATSNLIMAWNMANQKYGIVNQYSNETYSALNLSDSYWLLDCSIPEGGFISSYDSNYYSSFDLTGFNLYGNIRYVPDFREFTLADGQTKIKIPDLSDDVYDEMLPGDGYLASPSTLPSNSGTLLYYPMLYLSGYTIENRPETDENTP